MNKKWLALLLCIVFAVGIFSECSFASKKIRIGFALPTQATDRWVRDEKFAQSYCKKLGINLISQFANEDASRQLSQCENLISQGVDVLIVAAQDSTSAAAIVESAHKAHIPVVAYERIILNSNPDVLVQFDNEKVGAQQAQYVLEHAPKGNYVILGGGGNDANSVVFHKGQMSAIQNAVNSGNIKIVMDQYVTNWDASVALRLMENALTSANNHIQGVIATNDDIAGAAIEAMAAQGLSGIPISGQDATLGAVKRILKGTQSMTIYKDTSKLSKAAIDQAIKLAKGQPVDYDTKVNNGYSEPIKTLSMQATVITAKNIDVLIKTGYYTHKDIYGK